MAKNGKKKVHFYDHFIDNHPSPYTNVEFQVFHLTLTLKYHGGERGDVICAIITNSQQNFCPRL